MSNCNVQISNEELGKRVKNSFERHQQYVEAHKQEWKEKGKALRHTREIKNISRTDISEKVGVSTQTLRKLEKGKSVRSRKMLEHSFETAIKCIELERKLKSIR